jgi:hypothetical protein
MEDKVVGFVFLLNLKENYLLFMDWPDQMQYLSRQALILLASRRVMYQI